MRTSLRSEGIVNCLLRHSGVLASFFVGALLLAAVPGLRDASLVQARMINRPSTEGFLRAARPTTSDPSRQDILLPSERKPSAPERAARVTGVYLTASHAANGEYVDGVIDQLLKSGMSAVVFDVKGSRVYFNTTAPMAHDLDLVVPLLDLPPLVAKFKEQGIYTIARFISLKDNGLAAAAPSTQIRHPTTGRSVGANWVDAAQPDTLAYNRELMTELVQSGVDEINLDYIRYPTEYAPSQIGLTGAQKAEHIEKFLRMAREVIDTAGHGTKLGISTYAILGWNFPVNFEPLGQDIGKFAEIVDIVSPMAYPATFAEGYYYTPGKNPRSRMYYLVWQTLQGYKKLVGPANTMKLRPWIQGYYASARDLQDQIDAVYDAGLCGFTVWSAGNYYDTLYSVWSKQKDREEKCLAPTFDEGVAVQ